MAEGRHGIGRYLERRWLGWHLLWIALVAMCLVLSWWQFKVALAPHVPGAPVQTWRNYAYGANWLVFAGVAVWFWWRFMRDQFRVEDERLRSGDADLAAPATPSPRTPSRAVPPAPGEFDIFAGEDSPASGGAREDR